MTRVSVTGGRVIDPANGVDAQLDLHIAEGDVIALGGAPDGFEPERVLDAKGLIVVPGLVDLRARLREPGLEHKATIASETRAAVAGGVTTLCCPPDTDPVLDTPAVAQLIRRRAEAANCAQVVTLGALTQGLKGEQLAELAALKRAHCVGVTNALEPITNTLIMRRAMEYAASHDLTVFLHAEDHWLRNGGVAHEGAISTRLGLPGIPEAAETVAVGRELMLIEQTGVRAHFCQLSSALAVKMIARARHDGLRISTDVTAHHLHLTDLDVGHFNANCHVRPPLRSERDRDGLIAGLTRHSVDAICSDHQPHDVDAKLAPFAETEPGISAIETLLPLSLRLHHDSGLPLHEVLACLTVTPARILGLAAGTLGVGAQADVCIFDPDAYWTVSENTLVSRGKNSPFLGWELRGRVRYTLVAGRFVYELPS